MPINRLLVKAIFFDLDGTLRDTDDQYVERVARLLAPIQAIFPHHDSKSTARFLVMRLEGPVNGFFALADKLGLDALLHRIVEMFSPSRNNDDLAKDGLVPRVAEVLAELGEMYPLALVTTRGHNSTYAFLNESGILAHFDVVVSAQTTQRGKPKPDPILWAAKKLGIMPENCLMVGDTVMDIQSGAAAGCQTIGVLSGFGEEKELLEDGADLILPSVAEIRELLLKQ